MTFQGSLSTFFRGGEISISPPLSQLHLSYPYHPSAISFHLLLPLYPSLLSHLITTFLVSSNPQSPPPFSLPSPPSVLLPFLNPVLLILTSKFHITCPSPSCYPFALIHLPALHYYVPSLMWGAILSPASKVIWSRVSESPPSVTRWPPLSPGSHLSPPSSWLNPFAA